MSRESNDSESWILNFISYINRRSDMKRIILFFLLIAFEVGVIPQPVTAAEAEFNYVDAFAKSILFYEANWCGPDAGNNRIKWRGP